MAEPARDYSWPPFERGNTDARKHGAYRETEIVPLAGSIAEVEAQAAPWLGVQAFGGHLTQLARAEAISELLWRYVAEHGPLDEDGNPRAALAMLDRWMGRAGRLRGEAGLTPAAWAKQLASLSPSGDGGTGQLEVQRAVGAQILAEIERRSRELPEGGES